MPTLSWNKDSFLLDEQPHLIISGAMHYPRVVPELWRDRLRRLRAMGCNTVETYVFWNFHERSQGEWDFTGPRDLRRFIEIAAEEGLNSIVRPGPYVCAEWEFGGFPAYLLRDGAMRVRCMYQPYLDAVSRYFDELLPQITPLQSSQGGPVLAVQVENEYGSFGNDHTYLAWCENALRERGVDVPLFTSDGPSARMLSGGTLPHILKTVNFGSKPAESFEILRQSGHEGPLMCMEFWNGWFDHWGEEHHTRDLTDAAETLEEMLKLNASVNFYMAHGGTNFGLWAGANHFGTLQPTVTSYDYDAAIAEDGTLTPKFFAYREVISRYAPVPDDLPAQPQFLPAREFIATRTCPLLGVLPAPIQSAAPQAMEFYGQERGLILYRTQIENLESGPLEIHGLADHASVFLNGKLHGILRRDEVTILDLVLENNSCQLDILVEAMGRVNYGAALLDRKGIGEGVRLDYQYLFNWQVFPLPLDEWSVEQLEQLAWQDATENDIAEGQPAFYEATIELDEVADTFLEIVDGKKGLAWVNGHLLGRYWERGPQKTLYVPAPWLQIGINHIVWLELEGRSTQAAFRERAYL